MSNGKKKSVKGVVTKGLSNYEYMKLYGKHDVEERVKAASNMDVLDRDFYRKLIRGLKADPEMREAMRCLCVGVLAGSMINVFTYGVYRVIV